MLLRLKALLRRLLLRGPLLSWWVQRRGRQIDKAYCRRLIKSTGSTWQKKPAPTQTAMQLRKLLFVADCMWEINDLVPELQNICEVEVLDLRASLQSVRGEALPLTVLKIVESLARTKALEPDLVFLYARPALLSEELFHLIRKRWHCPLLGMSLDDKIQHFDYRILSGHDDNYQRWAKNFDLNITNTRVAVDWYRQNGCRCIYSPQGVHRPPGLSAPESSKYSYELGFVGSIKPERELIVNQLSAMGIKVELFGSGWPQSKWVDDPGRIYRETQINLGIGFASPSLTLTTVKGRDFECPGVGACYLTTYNWELAELYEMGKEILCYRSVEELIEMYSYYRPRRDECLRIAQAAWRRSGAEHTWEHRFRQVFCEMGYPVA